MYKSQANMPGNQHEFEHIFPTYCIASTKANGKITRSIQS